jgi:thiamine biosynthesis protein ThiS
MITVNGRPVDHEEGESVTDLLKRMDYLFPLVIVKIDGKLVQRDEYQGSLVPDGSEIEVIHLTSGG